MTGSETKYTKEQIKEALIEEMIEAYGGLSHNKETGEELNTPYMVLGIFEAAWERLIKTYQA